MRRAILVAALAAIVGLTIAAAGGLAATKDDNFAGGQRFARIDPSLLTVNGSPLKFVPASISNKPVSVMLELSGAPVAVQDVNAKKQGQKLTKAQKDAIRAQLKGQQDSLTGGIQSAGGTVVSQLQDAYNGVQVVVPQKNVPQLAALPGVAAVHAVQLYQRDNTHTDPYVGAPQAWGDFHFTGKGVNVAIIDTGVDYTHADFGGPGTPAAYQAAAAHDTTAADPTMFGPSAPKVKGGFDLVGDAYNPVAGDNTPVPDPNPLDCAANRGGGHGTHTAGTLAGFGVTSDGKTYKGTYDANTISGNQWTVGPGVAPEANLYEYRVFGCTGATNVLAEAINMAVAQGNIDVISMSIGAPLGGNDDPSAVAAQNAVDEGIAVVASAGNNGAGAYVVGSPSTASGVLSVAALDATPTFPAATFSPQGVTAINANGADIPTNPLKILVLKNADGSVADGCFLSEYPTGVDLSSTIVVVRRGGPAIGTTGACARVHKAYVGQAAGAAAVAMISNSPGLPPFEGKITSDPNDPTQTGSVHIPFLGISGSGNNPPVTGDGDAFTIYSADGQTTTLSGTTVSNPGFTLSASFTSGGPRNPDSAPKPDVIAPGVSVASAGVGTGTEAAIMSGTSMACPATAGVAALVKQAHPTWSGLQIKAAIMNTADSSLNGGYNSRTAGAGEVQAQKAVNSATLAMTGDELHALAFGFIAGTGDVNLTKSFTLTNNATSPVTYNLSVAKNASRGETITVPPSVTIAAHSSQTVPVTLAYTAAAVAALPTDDTFAPGPGPGGVVTSRGDIVATPASGSASYQQRLEIPYMAVPRGLSNVVAGTPGAFTKVHADTWSSTLPLSNSGIHTGTADLYTWGIHDPQETTPAREWDVRDAGVQILPGAALGGTDADRSLVFLVNTYGAATNQSIDEYDVVIDTNGDGSPDYVVAGADDGAVFAGAFNGIMDSFVINVATGAIVDAYRADAPMNGTTIELPALASEIGLSSAKVNSGAKATSAMTYAANSFSELSSGTDTTSAASIDVFDPPVSSGDFATLAPNGGTASMTLTLSKHIKQNPALGWLVASVDDASGAAQADEVAAPTVK
jgi:minor extracellular serine protease Vpr